MATLAKDPHIYYPIKNPFFPKDLKVHSKTEDNSIHCICKSIKQMIWYGKDNKFEQPWLIANVQVYTPDIDFGKTVKSKIFIQLWEKLV